MTTNYVDATTTELFRRLNIRSPTTDQQAAADRILSAADGEVTAKLGRTDPLDDWMLQLATEVTLQRGAELWNETQVPFGFIGLDSPTGPTYVPRKSRALAKLLPAQQSWGVG